MKVLVVDPRLYRKEAVWELASGALRHLLAYAAGHQNKVKDDVKVKSSSFTYSGANSSIFLHAITALFVRSTIHSFVLVCPIP